MAVTRKRLRSTAVEDPLTKKVKSTEVAVATEQEQKQPKKSPTPTPSDIVAACAEQLKKCAPNGLTARELSLLVNESPVMVANKLNAVLGTASVRKSLAENSRRNVYFYDEPSQPSEAAPTAEIPLNSPKSVVADNDDDDIETGRESRAQSPSRDSSRASDESATSAITSTTTTTTTRTEKSGTSGVATDSQDPNDPKDSSVVANIVANVVSGTPAESKVSLPLSPPPDSTFAAKTSAVVNASKSHMPSPPPTAHLHRKPRGHYLTTTSSRFMTTSLVTEPNPYYDDVFSSVIMPVDDWAWACNDAEMDNLISPESISLTELDEMLL